ncbi:hypothetical protein HYW94_03745 [Candidatus Uhrbacteria bacterium]|nr:hypothetical protein [Candidatus Uhrbacteria bacterium]
MGTHAPALSKLDAVEEKILRLIPLQDELRELAAAYVKRQKITVGEFGVRCGGTWKDAKGFLDGKRALSRGRFLMGLTILLSREDLYDKIEKEAADLQDRQISVALFPDPVVRTIFKVLKAHTRRSETVTRAIFSQAFSPHHETVLELFVLSHEALEKLRDDKTRAAIDLIVQNDGVLDTEIEAQLQRYQHRVTDLTRVIERLSRTLLPYYQGQYKLLGEALNIPETSFQGARQGKSSEAYLTELIEKMRVLAQLHGVGEHILKDIPAKKETPADATQEKPKKEIAPIKEISPPPAPANETKLTEAGGVIALDGTQYCITAADLDSLSLQNSEGYIAWTTQALEIARWALNIGTKLKDPVMRGKIRKALSKETRELYFSIQAFEMEYPGVIAPLLDAQRTTFLGKG